MNRKRKASSMSITEYSSIAQGLLNVERAAQDCINRYMLLYGKRMLGFANYPNLHELEILGQAYKTKDSAKVQYI